MQQLMHIHFSFLFRSKRSNSKGESPIVLRIIYREERRDLYTGLYCVKEDWDAAPGTIRNPSKQASTINRNLELINHQALNRFYELKFSGNLFTIDELVDKLKGREEKPTLLIDYLRSRNKELLLRAGVDIIQTTYEKYERSLRFMGFWQRGLKLRWRFLLRKFFSYHLMKKLNGFIFCPDCVNAYSSIFHFQYLRNIFNH